MDSLIILGLILFVSLYFIWKSKNKTNAPSNLTLQVKEILQKEVPYYQALLSEEKTLFEKRIQLFLNDKKITGVDVTVDNTARILVAASAVIPSFSFPDYNYPNIREILLYNNTFDDSFLHPNQETKQDRISGMVGNGLLNQVVMLSKPDLIADFQSPTRHQNVGVHEFTHLLDKTDGIVDGVPENLLPRKKVNAWLNEMNNEVKKIRTGESDLSPYALTNDAEFFAVASEYFFTSPTAFKKNHPELLEYLQTIFHQKITPEGLDPAIEN